MTVLGLTLLVAFIAHLALLGRLVGGNGKWYPTGGRDDDRS